MAKKVLKKAAAKKTPAKKTTAKKVTAKKAAAKKTPAKKPAEPVKKVIKRVPPRIVKRPSPPPRPPVDDLPIVDSAKAVADATNIALAMKRAAAQADQIQVSGITLSRRPTTRAQGKETAKFPATDLREFKKLLLEARTQAMNGVSAMRATGFNEAEDHEADGGDGTNQTLRLQALGQMGSINRTIQQIDEALHRIEDGSYGVCTACGQLIRKPRLLNQPFVLTCMECQSEMEREQK